MVDFDKLKEILTGKLDANIDKYSFNWNGKKRSIKLSQAPTVATLKPNSSKSKNLMTLTIFISKVIIWKY